MNRKKKTGKNMAGNRRKRNKVGIIWLFLMLIWLMVGFSLTAYADSWFMWKLFRPYFAQNDGEELVKDTEPDQYVF